MLDEITHYLLKEKIVKNIIFDKIFILCSRVALSRIFFKNNVKFETYFKNRVVAKLFSKIGVLR